VFQLDANRKKTRQGLHEAKKKAPQLERSKTQTKAAEACHTGRILAKDKSGGSNDTKASILLMKVHKWEA